MLLLPAIYVANVYTCCFEFLNIRTKLDTLVIISDDPDFYPTCKCFDNEISNSIISDCVDTYFQGLVSTSKEVQEFRNI